MIFWDEKTETKQQMELKEINQKIFVKGRRLKRYRDRVKQKQAKQDIPK